MKITTGQAAPDFTMFDTEKKKVSLSDFKGKNVLLLFFPQAFTGVCTKELCSIRDHIAQYEAVNAQVIGISVDSLFTLNKYKADQQLNFPLLSDFNKNVSEDYGCLYETFAFEMKGVSKRSAFIINKEGVIEYAEVLENAGELPNFEAIEKTLATLS